MAETTMNDTKTAPAAKLPTASEMQALAERYDNKARHAMGLNEGDPETLELVQSVHFAARRLAAHLARKEKGK
jgi:hypothetical protein